MKKLFTNWVKIATSGATIDGREISAEDLQAMATSYSTKEYTAVINFEHKWGNYGTVEELRTTTDDKGRMCLEAILSPNMNFIERNKFADDKKYFSIEILQNFANTGKPYLKGLAITDEPASLGIEEFSARQPQACSYAGEQVAEMEIREEKKGGFFSNLFNKNEKESSMELDDFKKALEEANSIIEQFKALLAEKTNETSQELRTNFAAEKAELEAKIEKFAEEKAELEAKIKDLESKIPANYTVTPNNDNNEEEASFIC